MHPCTRGFYFIYLWRNPKTIKQRVLTDGQHSQQLDDIPYGMWMIWEVISWRRAQLTDCRLRHPDTHQFSTARLSLDYRTYYHSGRHFTLSYRRWGTRRDHGPQRKQITRSAKWHAGYLFAVETLPTEFTRVPVWTRQILNSRRTFCCLLWTCYGYRLASQAETTTPDVCC